MFYERYYLNLLVITLGSSKIFKHRLLILPKLYSKNYLLKFRQQIKFTYYFYYK